MTALAPDDPRHGTRNGYGNLGCRCPACREANRLYMLAAARRNGVTPRDVYFARRRKMAEERDNHGTESRYSLGCRCLECTRAQNEARGRRRRSPNVKTHGDVGYRNGCRCGVCREAYRVFCAHRRAEIATAGAVTYGRPRAVTREAVSPLKEKAS